MSSSRSRLSSRDGGGRSSRAHAFARDASKKKTKKTNEKKKKKTRGLARESASAKWVPTLESTTSTRQRDQRGQRDKVLPIAIEGGDGLAWASREEARSTTGRGGFAKSQSPRCLAKKNRIMPLDPSDCAVESLHFHFQTPQLHLARFFFFFFVVPFRQLHQPWRAILRQPEHRKAANNQGNGLPFISRFLLTFLTFGGIPRAKT